MCFHNDMRFTELITGNKLRIIFNFILKTIDGSPFWVYNENGS